MEFNAIDIILYLFGAFWYVYAAFQPSYIIVKATKSSWLKFYSLFSPCIHQPRLLLQHIGYFFKKKKNMNHLSTFSYLKVHCNICISVDIPCCFKIVNFFYVYWCQTTIRIDMNVRDIFFSSIRPNTPKVQKISSFGCVKNDIGTDTRPILSINLW